MEIEKQSRKETSGEENDLELSIDEILADVQARREFLNPENRFIPPAVFEDALNRPSPAPKSGEEVQQGAGKDTDTHGEQNVGEDELEEKEKEKPSHGKTSAIIREPSPRQPVVPPAMKVETGAGKASRSSRPLPEENRDLEQAGKKEKKKEKRGWFGRRKKEKEESIQTSDPYYGLKLKSIEEYRQQYQETMAFPKIQSTTDSPFSYLYTEGEGENPSVLSAPENGGKKQEREKTALPPLDGEVSHAAQVNHTGHGHTSHTEHAEHTGRRHGHGIHPKEKQKRVPEEIFSFSSKSLREQAAEENRLPTPEEFPPELVKEVSGELAGPAVSSAHDILTENTDLPVKAPAETPAEIHVPSQDKIPESGEISLLETVSESTEAAKTAETAETAPKTFGENLPETPETVPAITAENNLETAEEQNTFQTVYEVSPEMEEMPSETAKVTEGNMPSTQEEQEESPIAGETEKKEEAPAPIAPQTPAAPNPPSPEEPQITPAPSGPEIQPRPSEPSVPSAPSPAGSPASIPEMPAMPQPGAGSVILGEEKEALPENTPVKEPSPAQPLPTPEEVSQPIEEPRLPETPLLPRILRLETRKPEEAFQKEENSSYSEQDTSSSQGASFLHAVDLNSEELAAIFQKEMEEYLHPEPKKSKEKNSLPSKEGETIENTIQPPAEATGETPLPSGGNTGAKSRKEEEPPPASDPAPENTYTETKTETPLGENTSSSAKTEFSTDASENVEKKEEFSEAGETEDKISPEPAESSQANREILENSKKGKEEAGGDSKGVPPDALFPFIQPIDPRTREDMPTSPQMRMHGSKTPGAGKRTGNAGQEEDKASRAGKKEAKKKAKAAKKESFRMTGVDEPENRPEEDFEKVSREQKSIPVLEDYTSPEDGPAIRSYLNKTHHTVVIRLLATGLMALVVIFLECISGSLFGNGMPSLLRVALCVFFLLISCLFCGKAMKNGLKGLFTLKANGDSGVALGTAAALLQGILLLFFPDRLELSASDSLGTFCSLAALGLFLNSAGKLLLLRRMRHNFAFLTDDSPKYGVKCVEDVNTAMQMAQNCVPGVPTAVYQRKALFLHHFLRHSEDMDPADTTAQTLSPVGFLSSLILGGAAFYLTHDFAGSITAFAAGCCVWIPVMNLLAVQLPLSRVTKLGKRCGSILTGYTALDTFSDTNAVVVDSGDIFPPSTVVLNGIRTFGDQRIDGAILDATALTKAVGGSLSELFGQVIRSQAKILPKAENIFYEDGLGILGWVNGRRTLVGNREMLEKHGIEPPSRDYEKKYLTGDRNLIYLASGGELVAMFLITYTTSGRVMEELQRLEDHGVCILVRTCDPNMTPALLAERFGLDEESIRILPNSLGEPYYNMLQEPDPQGEATMATKGKFTSMARMVVACIRQRGNISMGTALQAVAVVLGFVLTAFLVCCSAVSQLTPGALLLYELFWTIAIYIVPSLRQI